MSGYVDHAWRHAPKSLGGTDPLSRGAPAAKFTNVGATISCGGGFGASSDVDWTPEFDNIGLTGMVTPANLDGPFPVYSVHSYYGLTADGSFLSSYQLWITGPVDPPLYFSDVYFDSSEFLLTGYHAGGHAFGAVDLSVTMYLNGASDMEVDNAYLTVVYLGQSGPI